VTGSLVLAGLAATTFRTDFAGGGPPATVPEAGTLQVSGTGTTKTIPCNDGYLPVSGVANTITVTVSTSGISNVVSYHWGSPKIVNAGASNTVQQG